VFLFAFSLDRAARRVGCLTHIINTQYLHTCIQLHLPSSLPLSLFTGNARALNAQKRVSDGPTSTSRLLGCSASDQTISALCGPATSERAIDVGERQLSVCAAVCFSFDLIKHACLDTWSLCCRPHPLYCTPAPHSFAK
jgi:hypothetical protein